MLNAVFLVLVVGGTLTAAFTGNMKAVTDATTANAASAVELAIGLVGQMALWLGAMRIVEDAGFLRALSRLLYPVMRRLFPMIPAEHPALGAMILNIAANMMGLANAATPFGIKAMIELNKLNTRPGVATNAMALFLAINTSGVAVLPLGAIAVRATAGAENTTGIFFPTVFATLASTIVAIIAAKLLERLPIFAEARYTGDATAAASDSTAAPAPVSAPAAAGAPAAVSAMGAAAPASAMATPTSSEAAPGSEAVKGLAEAQEKVEISLPFSVPRALAALGVLAVLGIMFLSELSTRVRDAEFASLSERIIGAVRDMSGAWLLPLILVALVLAGFSKRVKVYESLVAGAKEAFNVGVMIIPFLVAILVAIGIFRASGAMDALVHVLGPWTTAVGVPVEVLPMALIRPLSGSGALGVVLDTMKTYGPDSLAGFTASVMTGSTETTFYVLAVYFGAVRVRVTRHTVVACLAADLTGLLCAVHLARIFWSPVAS